MYNTLKKNFKNSKILKVSNVKTHSEVVLTANQDGRIIQINKKAVIVAVVIVLILVIGSYVLTFTLPKGEYQRDDTGAIIQGTYTENPDLEGISWWQFLLSPVMILSPSAEGSAVVYAIIALLLVIGAIFTALEKSGILIYMINSIANRFKNNKYYIIFILSFAFMFLGSAVGMFEELIPLVPIVVILCYAMGWDALVGLGVSILAGAMGFAAGVVNPFSVGVAQSIGGIPMFSGIEIRLITFVILYAALMLYLIPYAKKIDKCPQKSMVYKEDSKRKLAFNFNQEFVYDKNKSKALKWFSIWMIVIIIIAIVSIFWHTLANYIMYITVAIYIVAGIGASIMCGVKGKELFKSLGKGMLTLLPAVVMIMIAGGIRYIIAEGDVMDTILYKFVAIIERQSSMSAVLLIYLVILVFSIFIPSCSGKAFLIMPLIFDLCSMVGINGQVAVLALAFADGFGNIFLPTNAGLLLILGMTTVDYRKWFKWSLPIQIALVVTTIGILALGHFVFFPA